jgi:hypothetical protein
VTHMQVARTGTRRRRLAKLSAGLLAIDRMVN